MNKNLERIDFVRVQKHLQLQQAIETSKQIQNLREERKKFKKTEST